MTTPLSLRRLAAAVGLGKLRRRVAGSGSVADVWGEQAGTWSVGGVRHWTELAEVQGVINRRVSGDATVDPYQYFLGKYLAGRLPVRNALTVGCGAGDLERGLCQYGFATRTTRSTWPPERSRRRPRRPRRPGSATFTTPSRTGTR